MGTTDDKNLDDFCKEYGEYLSVALKKMREDADYTQKELAKEIKISLNSISNFERNVSKIPAYVVKKYCDACQASADELLRTGEEFNMKKSAKAVAEELPDLPDKFLKGLLELIKAQKDDE